MKPILFGPSYSVYVRIAKIVLAEKGVDHDQVAFDVFDHNDWPADWPQRQPFGQVPAFEHDGFRLYETRAVTRYVDEAFAGPSLQPDSPQGRARMEQAISVLDGHGYRPMVWDIYVQRVSRGKTGESDEAVIASALPKAERCLAALAEILGDGDYFGGAGFSLADAQAAPIFDYFVKAPEGEDLLEAQAPLAGWWARVGGRESVRVACERMGAA
ncbi:glutathione S-transferase family protein [Pelagibius sp. 7325]|uniref:glutathione S-transferase family protein n=1 Tax=Pelagibius sp. 7325 TaxID=3131994 RepID=UPI0030EC7E19